MLNDVMTKPLSPAAAKLAERLAKAQTKLAATQALMTDEDRELAKMREDIAKVEEMDREAAAEKRAADLAQRFEAAADRVGGPETLRALSIKGFPDTFIVQRNGPAHAAWERSITEAGSNKKIDRADVARKYALASVIDWNGKTDFDDSVLTYELNQFLTKNPGVVTPITNEAAELNGVFKEERKSAS